MSADNLISVYETNEGDYWVSMQFASTFWEIEYSYWELEDTAKEARSKNEYAEKGYGLYRTLEDAVRAAHACQREEVVVEYGLDILLQEDRYRQVRNWREYKKAFGEDGPTQEYVDLMTERLALARRAKF